MSEPTKKQLQSQIRGLVIALQKKKTPEIAAELKRLWRAYQNKDYIDRSEVVHVNYPYPPSMKKAHKAKVGLADSAFTEFWKVPLSEPFDVYIMGILYHARSTVEFNTVHQNALMFFPQDTTDSEYLPWFQGRESPFHYLTHWWLYGEKSYSIPIKLEAKHVFELEVWNNSGATVDLDVWVNYFEGAEFATLL